MDAEQKLLLARVEDKIRQSQKRASAEFLGFLNEAEIAFLKSEMGAYLENALFFCGYPDAGRCMLGVFCDWEEPRCENFPIVCLKIENSFSKNLTHRDFLGSVLSLGFERTKIGDILAGEKTSFMFVSEDVADYICFNLKKIGSVGVKIKRATDVDELPKRKFKKISAVYASQRLDAVVSGALKKSRNDAKEMILAGKVSVNHKEVCDTSHNLKENDVISVRGEGRFILSEIGDETRSGRIHIGILKYVK